MMRLNIQGNLLNRTEALEAGRAKIDFSNVVKPYIDKASGAAAGGYIELDGGIKVSWGISTTVTGLRTINFPVTYTSAPAVSFARLSNAAIGVTDARYWCNIINSVSASSFAIFGDANYQTSYFWIAVGV